MNYSLLRGAAVPSSLREVNLSIIFNLLRAEGILSRAEIVRRTGISGPTVSSAIKFLSSKAIITEIGAGQGNLGRKPILLRFNPEAALTVGIDMGGNSIDLALVDMAGRIKADLSHPCAGYTISGEDLAILPDLVKTLLAKLDGGLKRILGVGVGIPGVTDPETHAVSFAPQLGEVSLKAEWGPLKQLLEDQFSIPLNVENDVNAAALGEQQARGRDCPSNFVFVSVGGGIGAGLVLDGRLYRGAHNAAGEICYMVFNDANNSSISDGFGNLERIASCPALIARARELGWNPPQHAGGVGEEIRQLGMDSVQGDHLARQALTQEAEYLALALANTISIYDPGLVVLGGVINEAGTWFIDLLNEYLNRICPLPVRIEASKNGSKAGLVGAAAVAFAANYPKMLLGVTG